MTLKTKRQRDEAIDFEFAPKFLHLSHSMNPNIWADANPCVDKIEQTR